MSIAGPLLFLLSASSPSEPFASFDATAPLSIGGPAAAPTTAPAACTECHEEQAREWERSRHRVSATNALFVDGFAVEPHARCAFCHAPLAEQSRDLLRATRAIVSRDAPALAAQLPLSSPVHDGIGCVTCHVRDGAVLVSHERPVRGYAHATRAAPSLRDPAFCASCHEFDMHEVVDGKSVVLRGVVVQSTYSEWQRYRAAGGSETCQSCHMPNGSHAFVRGAHDVAALRDALVVDIERDARGRAVAASFASRDVGHSYPSGDLFRHLTVSVDDGRELARFGKEWTIEMGADGLPHKRLARDTSLVPGERRRLPLPRGARSLKVTYHRADDAGEARGTVSYDELVVTVREIALR